MFEIGNGKQDFRSLEVREGKEAVSYEGPPPRSQAPRLHQIAVPPPGEAVRPRARTKP